MNIFHTVIAELALDTLGFRPQHTSVQNRQIEKIKKTGFPMSKNISSKELFVRI